MVAGFKLVETVGLEPTTPYM